MKKGNKKTKKSKINEVIIEADNESSVSYSTSKKETSKKKETNEEPIKLVKMVMENFKSFSGRHELGFADNFTAIIGPNGGGKSNVIEAIQFALSSNKEGIRAVNKKDFLNVSQKDQSQSALCFVELVFLENENEISFKKETDGKTVNLYFNKKKVKIEKYRTELQKRNINTNVLYYILSQGAVDLFFHRKTTLCDIINVLSGSADLEEEYNELEKQINEMNVDIKIKEKRLNEIKGDRDKIKGRLKGDEEFEKLLIQMNDLVLKLYLMNLMLEDKKIENSQKQIEEISKSIKLIEEEKKMALKQISQNESEIQNLENKFKQNSLISADIKAKYIKAKNDSECLDEDIKSKENELFNKVSKMNQIKAEQKLIQKRKNAYLKQKDSIQKEIDEILAKMDLNKKKEMMSGYSENQIKEYKILLTKLKAKNVNFKNQKDELLIQISKYKNQFEDFEQTLIKLENEKKTIESNLNNYTTKKEELNKKHINLENELNTKKNMLSTKVNSTSKFEQEHSELYSEMEYKLNELSSFNKDASIDNERTVISELIKKGEGKIFGYLYELITPLQKRLEIPIKISLIKYLGHLMVDNNESALIVAEFLQTKKVSINTNTIILENIPKYEIRQSRRFDLGNLGIFVSDLIDCKKKSVKNAVNFFLKELVYVNNKSNIQELRTKKFYNLITEDGTIYRKNMLIGGNYKGLQRYSFNYTMEDKGKRAEIVTQLNAEIKELANKIQNLQNQQKNQSTEITQLEEQIIIREKELTQTKNKLENMENYIQGAQRSSEEISSKIEATNNQMKTLTNSIISTKNEIENIEKKEDELKESSLKEYKNKNNLKDLKDFESISINLEEDLQKAEELKTLQNKILMINTQLKEMEEAESDTKIQETISELQSTIKQLKSKKDMFTETLNEVEKEFKSTNIISDEDKKKIEEYKNLTEASTKEVESAGTSLRRLIKSKIDQEYAINNCFSKKSDIIIYARSNQEKLLNDLGKDYINSPFRFSTNFNIDNYIKQEESLSNNKRNYVMNYSLLYDYLDENETTIESVTEGINDIKQEIIANIKEAEKQIVTSSVGDDGVKDLKLKEEENNIEKKKQEDELHKLINDFEELKSKHNSIKSQRTQKFTSFFELLKSKVEKHYKEITSSSNEPGGNALMYISEKDVPFKSPICYLPTPPGKRTVYDIDLLSGGERTIAVLVLIMSLREISLAPFIVMDEIDSYLDQNNEKVIDNLFKELSKNCQLIVVTHKNNIFKEASSLVGIYNDHSRGSSYPISLNLH